MDYQGNSNKSKEVAERDKSKVVEKVVSGEVVTRKKPLGRRLKDLFFGGEFRSAVEYITGDVLLPAARNLIVDATSKGVERMVYGETRSRSGRSPGGYGPRVMYNNPISRASVDPRERTNVPIERPRRQEPNEIILKDREEAEVVLERLIDLLKMYDTASLADLYDLLGLPSAHVDNKWGWTYLNNAQIIQVREGYLLSLPQVEPL